MLQEGDQVGAAGGMLATQLASTEMAEVLACLPPCWLPGPLGGQQLESEGSGLSRAGPEPLP